jgi:hypothetical protein
MVIAIGAVMAFRTRKHASGQANAAEPPASSNSTSTLVNASAQTQSFAPRGVGSDAMSDAFRKARLPSPLSNPDGDPDQAAAELARRVVAANEQSTAALLTAIRMSGISVRGDNGSLALESVKQGQGIYFDAWEVAAMAKLFGEGMQVKLVDLSNALSTTLPPFKGVAATMFVDGIQAAAQGNSPAWRFWGRFIVELGRQSAQPYDLLAQQLDPATVNLDATQTLLILRRLTVDIMIRSGGNKATEAGLSSGESFANGQASLKPAQCWSSVERPALHDAVWRGPRHPRLLRIAEGDNNLPCSFSELLSQLMDASAYAQGIAFQQASRVSGRARRWGWGRQLQQGFFCSECPPRDHQAHRVLRMPRNRRHPERAAAPGAHEKPISSRGRRNPNHHGQRPGKHRELASRQLFASAGQCCGGRRHRFQPSQGRPGGRCRVSVDSGAGRSQCEPCCWGPVVSRRAAIRQVRRQ